MMLFAICKHCKQTVEERETLDVCNFIKWECPFCGEWNAPVGQNVTDEVEIFEGGGGGGGEAAIIEHVVLEIAEIDPKNMEGNII